MHSLVLSLQTAPCVQDPSAQVWYRCVLCYTLLPVYRTLLLKSGTDVPCALIHAPFIQEPAAKALMCLILNTAPFT